MFRVLPRYRLFYFPAAVFLLSSVGAGQTVNFPIPPEDQALVDKAVQQLAAPDPVDRTRACYAIEARPYCDLPLLQAAAKDDNLTNEQRIQLRRLLKRIEPRVKAFDRNYLFKGARNKWRAKAVSDYYQTNGRKNPAWDADAVKFFELDGQRESQSSLPEQNKVIEKEQGLISKLISNGCDDPNVLTLAGQLSIEKDIPFNDWSVYFNTARKSIIDEKISPVCGVLMYSDYIRAKAIGYEGGIDYDNFTPTAKLMAKMLEHYTKAVQTPGMPMEEMVALAKSVMTAAESVRVSQKTVFDRVYPPLEAAFPKESSVLCIKGQYYIDFAWEARGSGVAGTVTPQGFADFQERIELAHAAYAEAYELDPLNPVAPAKMLTVALGENWDRKEVDRWFQRAMDADPDNKDACDAMMLYLEPKWHGSAAEMLDFGHKCLESGNVGSGIIFQLVKAHMTLAGYSADPNAYLQRDSVWTDMYQTFSLALQAYPDHPDYKNQYANICCQCRHWTEADAEFRELGANANPIYFGGKNRMDALKQFAAQNATPSTKR